METINILIGTLIGLAVGMQFWWNEKEYRKTIEKYREEAIKDADFWHKMYEKYRTAYEEEISKANFISSKPYVSGNEANPLSSNKKDGEVTVCRCECPTGREVDENFHQICTTCGNPTSAN